MFASTHVFAAFALSPAFVSPVARCNVTPPTTGSVDAFSTVTPAVADVSVTEQEPVVPTVVQLAALRSPGPLTFEKFTTVPAGAFTNVPEPVSTSTCAVNVCGSPTAFVAVNGLIEIFAFTTLTSAV